MVGSHTVDSEFHTLSGGVEAVAVGESFATYKGVGIKVDTPFHVAFRSLGEQILLLPDGGAVAIEGTYDVDFLIGCGTEGSDELQQDAVGTRLELLTLMVENDILVV